MGHLPDGAHAHGGTGVDGSGLFMVAAVVCLCIGLAPVIEAIFHILAIAILITLGVAIAGGGLLVAYRLRRRSPAPPWQPGTLQPPQRRAVPRELHVHIHGASPAELAAALAQLPQQSSGPAGPVSHYHPVTRQEPQP